MVRGHDIVKSDVKGKSWQPRPTYLDHSFCSVSTVGLQINCVDLQALFFLDLARIFNIGMAVAEGSQALWKLHLYDHCPFCIRVELFMGWSGIQYERLVYGYGDTLGDQKGKYFGGTKLTGKKQLPVLERPGHELLPESGDIIKLLQIDHKVEFPVASGREDLETFFTSKGVFKQTQRIISRGEIIKMTHIRDWAKPEDVAYAKEKYEQDGFSYEEAEAGRNDALKRMELLLVELDGLLLSDTSLSQDGILGFDDIMYLPELRTLSCAEGLKWPTRLQSYVNQSFAKANVETYFK